MEDCLLILVPSVVTVFIALYGYTVELRINQIKDELVKVKTQHIQEINGLKEDLKSKSMIEETSAHGKELEDIRSILKETDSVRKTEFHEMTKNITKYFKETDNRYYCGKALGDCSDLPEGYRSGIYKIQPTKSDELDVYCQMVDYGGGWTVIQRRESGDLDFFLEWTKYKEGFGRLDQEFWLGNDNIHTITSQGRYELMIDLYDFDNYQVFANYQYFYVGDESSNYRLNVYGYRGTAGDSLNYHNGMPFSTFDKDNDLSKNNCAKDGVGAWWFNDCYKSHLNGIFLSKIPGTVWKGIHWRDWLGGVYSQELLE
ncbi:Angiopoietin-related protein 1,Ficolin-1-A,Angiopoietin-1,Fibrinogen C domain-containing protein 1,Ryncolin-1,Tenascin-N,Angiopoietin-related protein 7,Angiopoietin-related protein 6,Ficolin-3,Fibroleukin,Fibrinogen-like protein 1,Ficolin-1,Ficolin-1-B,Tenascin-R,Ryncolin-2,Microfibril-associated glycoprotein 4,Fibrinogen-like protein A,Ryncolin-3,Fibrinogen gamma chain,Tenascin-X,Ficolin-2,Tenascin,Angiopoietin-related protein 2,Ryncolin-4,Techylectin-like protein [Mytilus edulis]|uniref:Fibrinogen C-terminal domain-containing protein n=1 Tax=Mytilus edulis TaxID=6550 RepID=A0A8S3V9L2_MYTED|nr:Angiopoietin-related protein 1,Ficolin-1-A,Angiopoietin-1,Fibrinogen C domain-containing protein 1,Ryncolin-1,Tenascin-N,Angiopoietin-related protein 7,Angiopoietin-related protein 6,Ficolin-3,Fibroleukin,Fibrinogen-like protein 1,Ficolin-1,Ficolin-1-B,Tenascin-R,Ryncolin-2,Microfibril-associated glycoprotein 4,Fibrinogen-like protein A,Ryncolin-3,Fibrinogen gamma chain,Tenascin-X,Ficolin-2,Tenascin,Angiopoietin-related protein 2,Ryncolin-4,Techylectin-like protein [Mytilus edulis]